VASPLKPFSHVSFGVSIAFPSHGIVIVSELLTVMSCGRILNSGASKKSNNKLFHAQEGKHTWVGQAIDIV